MKKLAYLIALFLILSTALAESSSPGYDELLAQRQALNMELWHAINWYEVWIPRGYYTVGQDLPAGKYRVACTPYGEGYVLAYTMPESYENVYRDSIKCDWIEPTFLDAETYTFVEGQIIEVYWEAVRFTWLNDPVNDPVLPDIREYERRSSELLEQMKACPEWEEFTIEEGDHLVGDDVPVGHWTVWPPDYVACGVQYSDHPHGLKDGVYTYVYVTDTIRSPEQSYYKHIYDIPNLHLWAYAGNYIYIDRNPATFTTYAGTDLFKFVALP